MPLEFTDLYDRRDRYEIFLSSYNNDRLSVITDLILGILLTIAVVRGDPSKAMRKSVKWSQIYLSVWNYQLKYINEKYTVLAVCQCE